MNLVIDIGNSRAKLAVFNNGQILSFTAFDNLTVNDIKATAEHGVIENCILSGVKEVEKSLLEFLSSHYKLLILSHETPLPLKNNYETAVTLGNDRIASAVGACALIPGGDILIIDAGTAITYDLVLGGKIFVGGGISPGLTLRFKALNAFTGKLPLINDISAAPLIGVNTTDSIRSGVINGAICEMEGIIGMYLSKYPSIEVILTGGNHYFFDKQLKIKTFAAPNLVLDGLNIILDFNIAKNNLI
jgi:type III pantothenate kinase